MKQSPAAQTGRSRPDRIRALGFRPEHLTKTEQEELLELEMVLASRSDDPKRAQLAHR